MGVHRIVLRNRIQGEKELVEEIAYTRDEIHPGEYLISCGDCGKDLGAWIATERQTRRVRDRSLGVYYAQMPVHVCT